MHLLKKLFSGTSANHPVAIPGNASDKRLSAIYSHYQQPGKPTASLLNQSLKFIHNLQQIDLKDIAARIPKTEVDYISLFPGEHYHLLASIVDILKPKTVIELGTHLGYSSLCMKKYLPEDGSIYTFDVIPWNGFENTILRPDDFDHRLIQHLDDTTAVHHFNKHKEIFENADLVFMDALKDGIQEYKFLENFKTIRFKNKCLFVFDDIRLWNMLAIWFDMDKPKFDLTSYGHWSGTGLVEWN
jgi:predicted O-methyltransferase YrrM